MLPASAHIYLTPDLPICRILNGMWQASGAHGAIDSQAAIADMFHHRDAGFTTWDLADHDGTAEELIGEFRRQLAATQGKAALAEIQALTNWVPRPGRMTRQIVEDRVDRALQRLKTPAIDLMQFHWWDYRDPNYLDALQHLTDLQQAGKIQQLGLTNFDTEHLKILLDEGIPIVSNQVQYSLIDRRPEVKLVPFCQQRGLRLLAYGTLCGGLLTERFLGAPEPGDEALQTASLRKYKPMVDAWGGWALLQALLQVLQEIAYKHRVGIANVAVRYVLERPTVAGATVGCRLGIADHLPDNARVFDFQLDVEDYEQLETVLRQGRNLFQVIGDCGAEYRR
jgi:aryl-alcohol dehydrogenase-like predicted oxidoreductase